MDRRFHKRAISAAAAVMTLTMVVTSVDAAEKNEITIESTDTKLEAGENFGLTVGYSPDGLGAAGFTIDLHYDTEAVTLNEPDEADYAPDSKFALVTNFEYGDGTVRIVGVNLSGTNVTDNTVIADLDFTVNDGYSGEIEFWTEVEDLVAADNDEFVNVDFRAYGEYTPYTLEAEASVTTAAPAATTAANSETEPAETLPPETTTTETEAPLPDQVIPPATTLIPETNTAPETTTLPEDEPEQEIPEDTVPEEQPGEDPSYDDPAETAPEGGVLFEHKQGSKDYNSEEALQYIFSPYDYAVQSDDIVDIAVTIESDGSASGGIGMQTKDGWQIYSGSSDGSGKAVWTADDVDLSEVESQIAVQIYYLEHDSEFKITDISVTINESSDEDTQTEPSGEANGDADTSSESTESDETSGSEETDNSQPDVTEAPANDTSDEDTEDKTPEDSFAEDQPSDSDVSAETADSDSEAASDDAATDSSAADDVQSSAADSAVSQQNAVQATNSADSAADTSSAVTVPAATASDGNPLTGTGFLARNALPGGIIALCLAQICYSTYRLTRKEQ